MTAFDSSVLVDTNIVCYLLLKGDRTNDAQKLFTRNPNWISEAFLLIEFSNVLATLNRAKNIAANQVQSIFKDAIELFEPNGLKSLPHDEVLKIACEFSVSAYDARFLAIARNYNLRLITEDKRLRVAAPELTQSLAEALTGDS